MTTTPIICQLHVASLEEGEQLTCEFPINIAVGRITFTVDDGGKSGVITLWAQEERE